MFFIIGVLVVFGGVLGGYTLHGGNLAVLWQPTEAMVIFGAIIGGFLIGNPPKVVKGVLKNLKTLLKSSPYNKQSYVELLTMLYSIFRLMRTKGMLELESHIEDPHNSSIFTQYPKFLHNHHAIDFLCDYLRLMTMGVEDYYQLEELMEQDLDALHHESERISGAMLTVGDSFPAIGIVAAVLGVIITMASITEPPEVLGGLIGAALVGTFAGVFISYCFVSPMGKFLGIYFEDEHKYLECIKKAILAHLKGNAPAVSVEFARKVLPDNERPSFKDVEDACGNL